ncbi:MAG: DUF4389 domain-containing protein [Deltaproteobacteria bacterium]
MVRSYPAHFDAIRPERYDRAQVFLRIAVVILLAVLRVPLGTLLGVLCLGLPVLAAVLIAQGNGATYLEQRTARMIRGLRAVIAFLAWLTFLTDRFPSAGDTPGVRFDVEPHGSPTVASALLRLITSIPAAIVAIALWFVAGLVGFTTSIMVLAGSQVPAGLYDVQRGTVRWIARLAAYHASLVDQGPPFAFDTESEAVMV